MTDIETIRFIDLFGGIGGFRHGLEQASEKYECVDYIEYDKYAVKSYNEIFGEEHEPRDVTELSKSEIADHDLLCAGFPCQSFSVAGNRKGTDEARGKLFREIVRIAEAKEPEMLLLENVKGLLSQKAVQDGESISETKGHAFTEVLQALHELGYCLEWQVLNSKHWGVPQNRERIFIIGHLGGEPRRKVFPVGREDAGDSGENRGEGKVVTHPTFTARDYEKMGQAGGYLNSIMKVAEAENPQIINHQMRPESRPSIQEEGQSGGSGVLFNSEYSYSLTESPHFVQENQEIEVIHKGESGNVRQGYSQSDTVIGDRGIMTTVQTSSRRQLLDRKNARIRKLTPKECWRLQGFPDESFETAQKVNSDTQLYKQAGNAVTVNVIKALGEEIKVYFGETDDES